MPDAHKFDYDQPSLDALAGICVAASDSGVEKPTRDLNAAQGGIVVPAELEGLFGLTVTVDDKNTLERPSPRPRAG
jgi:hypothetical protein